MNKLGISISPKQMSRLRNGHRVRVKKGEGCSVIVDPETYTLATRTFGKNKGLEIQLSPEMLEANRAAAPEMEGKGIFGKKFDKALKKAGIKKLVYKAGDALKPMVKEGIEMGMAALGPEMAIAGAPAKEMLFNFLDKPSDFGVGGKRKAKKELTDIYGRMAGDYATSQLGFDPRMYMGSNPYSTDRGSMMSGLRDTARQGLMDYLSSLDGSNAGYMGRAGYGSAAANARGDFYSDIGFDRSGAPLMGTPYESSPYGMSGFGIAKDARRMAHSIGRKTRGIVGMGAGMVGTGSDYLPQALIPQPFGANFQMQNMLPPQYHKFASGTDVEGHGLYAGAYSGRGMYA